MFGSFEYHFRAYCLSVAARIVVLDTSHVSVRHFGAVVDRLFSLSYTFILFGPFLSLISYSFYARFLSRFDIFLLMMRVLCPLFSTSSI